MAISNFNTPMDELKKDRQKRPIMIELLQSAVIHVLSIWGVLFVVFLLGTAFFIFYRGGVFSWYFFIIFSVFIVIAKLERFVLGKIDNKSLKKSISIPEVSYLSLLSMARVVFISIFPILIIQIFVKFLYEETDLKAEALSIESNIIQLDRALDSMQAEKYLGYGLLIVLVLGLFVSVRGSKAILQAFRGFSVINLLLFTMSFSFFTAVVANESEKEWRAEKRSEIFEKEAELSKAISETMVLNSVLMSNSNQQEIMRVLSAILATSATYELLIKNVKASFYRKLSSNNLGAVFNWNNNFEDNINIARYPVGEEYDPKDVVKYIEELGIACSDRRRQNWEKKDSVREILYNILAKSTPELPDDLKRVSVNAVVSVFTDVSIELLERSRRPARVLLLHTYLGAKEPITDRVIHEELNKEVAILIKSIDNDYIEEVNKLVAESRLIINKAESPLSDWLEKTGKSIARAARSAL